MKDNERIYLIREIISWIMFIIGSALIIANTSWQVSWGIFLFVISAKIDIMTRVEKLFNKEE